MTREELIDAIYTHDTIYLPPWEEGTPALEVALGCSWGKCLFCDFAKDTFKIHSLEKITFNMKCLGMLYPNAERLFLLGENAFCLSAQKLKEIFALTDSYMPFVQEFSIYLYSCKTLFEIILQFFLKGDRKSTRLNSSH